MATEKVRNVIIDTDPGIDDAMGIMMALEAHQRSVMCFLAFKKPTDYGRPIKPFFIEIQNFWAWADKLGR